MKRFIRALSLSLILILVIAIPVIAAYSLTIKVKETSGNAYTNFPFIASVDVTALASGGFITSSGLDTRVKLGTASQPHMLADDKVLFVSDVGANNETELSFTTGNTALTSFPVIVGNGGYITVADNAEWEPRDSFSLEVSLYIPDEDWNFGGKEDAIRWDYNATTDVLTATIGTYATPDYTLTATGVEPGEHVVKLASDFADSSTQDFLAVDQSSTLQAGGNGIDWTTAHSQTDADSISGGINGHSMRVGQESTLYSPWPYVGVNIWRGVLFFNTAGLSGVFDSAEIDITLTAVSPLENDGIRIVSADDCDQSGLVVADYGELLNDTTSMGQLDGGAIGANTITLNATGIAQINASGYTAFAFRSLADINEVEMGLSGFGAGSFTVTEATLSVGLADVVLSLFVDDMVTAEDTEVMTAPITDNANDWVFYPNPYFNYVDYDTSN